MSNAIPQVKGSQAKAGSRGEAQHVASDRWSLNVWHLSDMAKSELHTNDYDLVVYVQQGELTIYDESGDVALVAAGDSAVVPSGTVYAMSTESAHVIEFRAGL